MKYVFFTLCALILFFAVRSEDAAQPLPAPTLPVTIHTSHGDVPLTLELVTTPRTRARGLMDRDTLAPNDGMLFIFPTPEPLAFWMKNTHIPLDMLFIDGQGRIVHIARQAVPYSTTPIPSRHPAVSVIEIAGGRAAQDVIEEGDRVSFQLPAGQHVE